MLSNTELKGHNKRRKRKQSVILCLVLLLSILPTILCTVLFLHIARLQKQVNTLMVIVNGDELYEEKVTNNEKYAYAAEPKDRIHSDETLDIDENEVKEHVEKSDVDNDISKDKIPEDNQADKIDTIDDEVIKVNDKREEQTTDIVNEIIDTPVHNNQDTNMSEHPLIYNPLSRNVDGKYYNKKVYLTFDDGPSPITEDILEILDTYQVKATFFVIGRNDEWSKGMYQRIVKDGHTLGMHSFSHKYNTIYNSLEDFKKDFTKLFNLLYDTTGYKPNIYRFPGGSYNKVNKYGMEEFIRFLNNESIVYFDWNVDSGDASGLEYTKDQLIENVLNGIDKWKSAIVLLHDEKSKHTTLDSLPELLEELIREGAELLPLDNTVKPVQQIKASSVK